MKEILDEDNSVCFIHLYPSIVQTIGRNSCPMNPSSYHRRFFTEGFIGQCSATQAQDYKPHYLSLFSKLQGIYVLLLPIIIQVLVIVVFE